MGRSTLPHYADIIRSVVFFMYRKCQCKGLLIVHFLFLDEQCTMLENVWSMAACMCTLTSLRKADDGYHFGLIARILYLHSCDLYFQRAWWTRDAKREGLSQNIQSYVSKYAKKLFWLVTCQIKCFIYQLKNKSATNKRSIC